MEGISITCDNIQSLFKCFVAKILDCLLIFNGNLLIIKALMKEQTLARVNFLIYF